MTDVFPISDEYQKRRREVEKFKLARDLFVKRLYSTPPDSVGSKAIDAISHAERFMKTWERKEVIESEANDDDTPIQHLVSIRATRGNDSEPTVQVLIDGELEPLVFPCPTEASAVSLASFITACLTPFKNVSVRLFEGV